MSEYTFYSRAMMFGRIAGGHMQIHAMLYEVKGAPAGPDGKPVLKPTGIVSMWITNRDKPPPGVTSYIYDDVAYDTFADAKAKWLEDLAAGKAI